MADFRTRTALALPLALLLSGCGGGPQRIGEITPPVVQRLSGAWALNAEESDDPQEAMAQAARRGGPARGGRGGEGGRMPPDGGGRGGMPGAGGRGGRPGGGGMMPPGGEGGRPGMRGPGGGDGNSLALQATRRMMTVPPRRVEIALTDSLVTVAYGAGDVWALPFGEKVERGSGELKIEAKASWENERLVVTTKVKDGGTVTETYMPAVDGSKLTVVVVGDLGRGGAGGVEFRRVYDRGSGR